MFNSLIIDSSPISYPNDSNPISDLLEELPYCSSYYHLPSPFIYNEIDNFGGFLSYPELTIIQQDGLEANSSLVDNDTSVFEVTNRMDSNKSMDETINGVVEDADHNNSISRLGIGHGSSKRRSSKKDRHSKINTANGLRDRRMRLSLKVARPFFKLQEMLGYDKASRTIEWLLIQSKSAIQEQLQSKNGSLLSGATNCMVSSNFDYEVESVITEERGLKGKNLEREKSSTYAAKNINKPKGKRSTTKESRKEARDRARERTLKRMQFRGLQNCDKFPTHCSIWAGFEMVEGYNDSNSQTHQSNIINPIFHHQ